MTLAESFKTKIDQTENKNSSDFQQVTRNKRQKVKNMFFKALRHMSFNLPISFNTFGLINFRVFHFLQQFAQDLYALKMQESGHGLNNNLK